MADDVHADAARTQRLEELKPLRKELNRIDNRLGVAFNERDTLEAGLASGTLAAPALAEHGKRLKALATEIEQLEGRWLELSTRIDEMSAAAG